MLTGVDTDQINARVVPSFHTLLAAPDDKLEEGRATLKHDLSSLVQAADENVCAVFE